MAIVSGSVGSELGDYFVCMSTLFTYVPRKISLGT